MLTFDLPLVSVLPAGDYEVSIRFNDEHIPDSPFIVPVASPSDDARRLTVASLQVRLGDAHAPGRRARPQGSSSSEQQGRGSSGGTVFSPDASSQLELEVQMLLAAAVLVDHTQV